MQDDARALTALAAGGPYPVDLEDDLSRRLMGALNHAGTSALDLGVLVRQFVRRSSLHGNRAFQVDVVDDVSARLRQVAGQVGIIETGANRWTAAGWSPGWLDSGGSACDGAALAGTDLGRRFQEDLLPADPFFAEITPFTTYRTAGQRAACRAAISVPEGATIVCMLPTGSGKTEIALSLSARKKSGVTVIIVPTLALAADFERRFRELYSAMNRRIDPSKLAFAWTSATSEAAKDGMRQRIQQGAQPIVVTSPESMTRSLRQTMMDAAATGRFRGFVIDEAHLVSQWGRSFRPEFRTLGDFRNDLLRRAAENGRDRAVTLLLSATLGPEEMKDLIRLFGDPGPCTPIVANALRSEPDIWIARSDTDEQRAERVLETLAHIPRPAILYLTSPKTAKQWSDRLRTEGYGRMATVTGETSGSERARVLEQIRADRADGEAIDLVVATSAFGLGIDYAGIRSVAHACLPETVDRWYQETGRGGRDGAACAEYLLTAPADKDEAESLATTVLTGDTARKRWAHLWANRSVGDNGRSYIDLESTTGVGKGDYNRFWNAQLVQGLVELEQLERRLVDVEDLRRLLHDDVETTADWVSVTQIGAELNAASFWAEHWEPWRAKEMARSRAALVPMLEVSRTQLRACQGIIQAYAPDEQLQSDWSDDLQWMEPLGPCGRCPGCRAAGVPVSADPPPRPRQSWEVAEGASEGLRSFVSGARGHHGMAVLVERSGEDLGDAVAAALISQGVLHVGGEFGSLPKPPFGAALFRDDHPLATQDLTPVSSFSRFGPADRISPYWAARRMAPRYDRGGHEVVDILLVSEGARIGGQEVGRGIPALPAVTALELLRKV